MHSGFVQGVFLGNFVKIRLGVLGGWFIEGFFEGSTGPHEGSEFMGKTFQAAQLTHERFLIIDRSRKIFF